MQHADRLQGSATAKCEGHALGRLLCWRHASLQSLDTKDPHACYDHPGTQPAPSTAQRHHAIRWDINIPSTSPTAAWRPGSTT